MGTGVTSEPDNVNDSINEVKKMNDTSVFTDHLKILAEYSEKVDMGTATDDDFADFQQMLPRIIKAMQDGYYKMPEYVALTKIFYIIKEGFRVVLGLDQETRQGNLQESPHVSDTKKAPRLYTWTSKNEAESKSLHSWRE